MKHLFISHSWITQLVAEAVIEQKEIASSDVVFIYNRNFSFNVGNAKYQTVRVRKIPFKGFVNFILLPIRFIRFHLWLSRLLENNNYELYAPHFFDFSYRLLAKSRRCVSINLLEEGLMAFKPLNEVHDKFYKRRNIPAIVRWAENNYLLSRLDILPSNIKKAYKLSENAFREFPQVESVKGQVLNILDKQNKLSDVKIILALGAFVDGSTKMQEGVYYDRLRKLLIYILSNYQGVVHCKFHPSDSPLVRKGIKKVLAEFGKRFVLLSDSVSLESLIIQNKPLLITFNSSIALYALDFGCELIIATHLINEKAPYLEFVGYDLKRYYLSPDRCKNGSYA